MKKNTLSAILMTLFLFISCNNSGEGENSASTADESVKGPNLTEISKKITDSNALVLAVKEVETLVSSIDEIGTKAIGQRIQQGGLGALANHNGSLLAGAYVIASLITDKLGKLKSEELKDKIDEAKKCSEDFTTKLKGGHATLGIENATDVNAKSAILKTDAGDSGVKELNKLIKSVEDLAKAAQEVLTNSVQELTNPVVAEAPNQP
ncbi:Vsp/OspC family lipoprotein [Borreliella lusitaniae]|uniref:Vsp/OspC family lipoprotein n=1 Tax=Borreliella lusitaniae TaxID=100177 RepID=A0ABZ0CJX7_9SPIR|nr:Vsp/OspC family lipoprotein [Borreliella lusitaniae]WNY69063.1 Vsp/OspC family lipoprotein [Borreliella lusitaniae]